MNIDLCNNTKKQYLDMLSNLNLHQHVMKPTRWTNRTAILIGHIISNIENRISYVDVLPCPLVSDHDAVYACVNVKFPSLKRGTNI